MTQCYLQDVFSFSIVRRALLLQQGIESNPGPTTIGEAVEWYTETCQSGKRSEEQIKTEALRFFILTSAEQSKDKKLFKRALESLMKANTNQFKLLQKEARKMHNGKRGNYEIPPEDFCPNVSDGKKRKVVFSEQCREEVKVGRKYLRWIDTNFDLFSPNVKALKAKRSKNKDKLA